MTATPVRATTRQQPAGDGFAVSLPSEIAYADPEQELEVERVGEVVTLRPKPSRDGIADFVARVRRTGGYKMPPESHIRPLGRPDPWETS